MSTNTKRNFIALFLLLNSVLCVAHNQSTKDSLLHIISTSTKDSVKVSALQILAESGTFSNREESIVYYKQILNYKIDEKLRGTVLNRIGFFNWQLGNYEEAISSYEKALPIFISLKDSLFLGRIYNNIAVSHWGLGNNIEALSHYELSLEIRKRVKDSQGVSRVLNNIGKIYQDIQLFEEAFEMHNEALQFALEAKEFSTIAYSYANLGDCFQYSDQLDSALHNYYRGYNILLSNDSLNRSNSFFSSRIGAVYTLQNKLDSALFYNKKALAYALRINNQNRIALAEFNLGKTFMAISQTDSAKFYVNKSYEKALKKGYDVLLKDNLFLMAELEEAANNTTEAYKYYKQAAILNDSIYNKDVVSKVADTQVKYVTEQKERENLALRENNRIQESTIKQQRIISVLLVLLSFMTMIVLYFIAKSRASIKKLNQKLEESERHLQKANANKDRFFTIIAHDLRSPFNGILGITELLDNDFDKLARDHTKELIGMLRESTSNVFSLLNSLLQWAQTQQDFDQYKFTQLKLHNTSIKVCKTLQANAKNKQILLTNFIPEDTYVYADKNSIETVFRNLIGNAIKFTNEGGDIKVLAQQNNEEVIVEVTDNGIGIPKELQHRLFSITEQVSENGTKNELGTGLGLILCSELIKRNNGKIWFESSVGVGSSFFFSLPTKS